MDVRMLLLLGLLHFAQSEVLNLSCEQIKSFVDGHNTRRLMITRGLVPNQPPAVNIKFMIWDEHLAEFAEKMLSYVESKDNSDNSTESFAISGTLSITKSVMTTADPDFVYDIDDVLQGWFGKWMDYSYGSMISFEIKPYTQMVWSDSIFLGCAVSKKDEDGKIQYETACVYGPGGNIYGELPYKAVSLPEAKWSEILICAIKDCSHPYGSQCFPDVEDSK